MEIILDEFNLKKKGKNERNYNMLDDIAFKLKFFKRFTKPTRIQLLKMSQVIKYDT